ncbi:MAG: TetR family transcriptional regulator [Clostridia bacterium]|nr:TetR family transcriptional regulator [Clostridia bacterium]
MEEIMATAFRENEKEQIKANLKNAAQQCLGKFGVRKTTVDQLVQMAGISKGAFYIFYPSKEILFFTVLEEFQGTLIEDLFTEIGNSGSLSIQEFSELIYGLYKKVGQSFMMSIIQNQEFEYLIRKIPEEYLYHHKSFDDMLAKRLLSHLKLKRNTEDALIAASLRAIFMSLLHVKEIGEKEFDQVLKLLITGFAQQIIEEDGRDE